MRLDLTTPPLDHLDGVVRALREWQDDALSLQLHPGDLGWNGQFGAETLAASLRTWRRDGELVALGMLDSPEVLRLTVAPAARQDATVAGGLLADLADPARGVLPAGEVSVETPNETAVQTALDAAGWELGEAWSPLRRDLTDPVPDPGLRVEEVGPEQVDEAVAVHRSSFSSTRFTAALWHTMAAGWPRADRRSLLGRDEHGVAVATVTVWSAGPGRPGLLEPLGVHADHHGHGYGRAISLAAAAALGELGASSALVCTPSARVPAVATYRSAGFATLPERLDRTTTLSP